METSRWRTRIPLIGRWILNQKLKKERQERIHALQTYIANVHEEEFRNAKTPQEKGEADQRVYVITRDEENELTTLLQGNLVARLSRVGIEIPEKHWNNEEYPLRKTLSWSGEMWAKNEYTKYRDSRIEFWAKIILPILSLIVSIIALFRSAAR